MKTILRIGFYSIGIVLSVLGSISSRRGLKQDFDDIHALIPADELNQIFQDYIQNDEEVMTIFKYLTSGDLGDAWFTIAKEPEVQDLFDWINAHSVAATYTTDTENDTEKPEELLVSSDALHLNRTGGWKGFVQDYYRIYPRDRVITMIAKKVNDGGVFMEFWQKVQAMKNVYQRILTMPEVEKVVKNLSALGVDVEELDEIIKTEMNWN